MYEFHEFPKWKYHAEKEALIVESKEQELALGIAWVDSPALVVKTKEPLPKIDAPSEVIPDFVAQEIEELAEKVSALSRDSKRVRRMKS